VVPALPKRNRAVTHHIDRHELGLFERRDMLDHARSRIAGAFPEARLQRRGLYIAVKA
jgi:hypothetical protein